MFRVARSSLLRAAAARAPVAPLRSAPAPASAEARALSPLALAAVGGGAALWLSQPLGEREARCAAWSPSSSGGSQGGEGEDPVARAKEMARALAADAQERARALVPGRLGAEAAARVDAFLASGKGGQVTWGFLMGVCSGFALKKVSKVGAVAVGGLFVAMQSASYAGYVNVNYGKLGRDVTDLLDLNHDGKLDTKDADSLYRSLMEVLEFSLPAGSGYALGFLVGFRAG